MGAGWVFLNLSLPVQLRRPGPPGAGETQMWVQPSAEAVRLPKENKRAKLSGFALQIFFNMGFHEKDFLLPVRKGVGL